MLNGDVETGKAILRNYINATVGFGALGRHIRRDPKSIMRMLSLSGNPQAENLFEIVAQLQKEEHVQFRVRAAKAGA